MSEKQHILEENKEIPTLRDSLALQTYEFLYTGKEGEQAVDRFLSGEDVELNLPNLGLDEDIIDQHINNLEKAIDINDNSGNFSTEYRLAEAYFLKAAARLAKNPNPTQDEINQFQVINRELYGETERRLTNGILAKLWIKLNDDRREHTEKLYQELRSGFTFTANDGSLVEVPGLPFPKGGHEQLPVLKQSVKEQLQNILLEKFAPAKEVIDAYVEKYGEEISADKISDIFMDALIAMNIDVDIEEDENATALSWSSARNAVVVGLMRSPISGADKLLGLFAHEVGVHGQRSQNGDEVCDEALANGLFTDFDIDRGEEASYLPFEEGFASIIQKTVASESEKWDVSSLGNYTTIILASQGYTPRQILEIMSRVWTIFSEKSKPSALHEMSTEKCKKAAVKNIVRVFRGTSTSGIYKTSTGVTLHYAKDRAYLAGKVKVIDYLNNHHQGELVEKWDDLFVGKYDPTNHFQKEYVQKVKNNIG